MEVLIERMSNSGYGIAHTQEGKTVFVQGAMPEDVVSIIVDKEEKRLIWAHVDSIHRASKWRIEPACPYANICGGCPWACIAYEAQCNFKYNNICDAFIHIAKEDPQEVQELVAAVRPSKQIWNYRNKIELLIKEMHGKLSLGYLGLDKKTFVPITDCPLFAAQKFNLIHQCQGVLNYLLRNAGDIKTERLEMRYSAKTDSLEIALWTQPSAFPRHQFAKLFSAQKHITSLVRVMTKGARKARKIAGVERIDGNGYWTEELGHYRYRISAPSFFQVNSCGAQVLQDYVLSLVQHPQSALDLYCGAGTFTLPLAQHAHKLCALEAQGSSLQDLRKNLALNKIDNVEIIGGDAAREFPKRTFDTIVADPPRAGFDQRVIQSIEQSKATQLIYVSCNPATLARDSIRLKQAGFFLTHIQPFDLFPQTPHVESISVFIR